MKYTVIWGHSAEQRLAKLWLETSDRQALSRAANEIDMKLKHDPIAEGESREADRRLLLVPPIAAYYRVVPDDRIVHVLTIREIRRRN